MKQRLQFPALLLLTALMSCGPFDPCDHVNCLQGYCDQGHCVCPDHTFGPRCEFNRQCGSNWCYNDGYCNFDRCACPEGYAPPDCFNQLVPAWVSINRIRVDYFPETRQPGGLWDEESDADLQIVIKVNGIRFESEILPDHRGVANFNFGHTFSGDEVTETHVISLEDSDEPLNQGIASYNWTPYIMNSGFPKETSYYFGSTSITLFLSYGFPN